MSDPLPFDPHRFQTAAAHYLAGRTPYPAALIARVAQLCPLGATDRVLDLGCGPGQLGRAFAPMVADVVGIDPEPAMLDIARTMSGSLKNIVWRQGSSYDLAADWGSFKLVCIGRAFHWMDRSDTLRRLNDLIAPDGAVALFADSQPRLPDNAWRKAYREVLDRYEDDEPSLTQWRAPTWIRHEAFLLDSAFAHLEQIRVIYRHEIDTDTLIARALSRSSTSARRLGDRTEQMIADLRRVFEPYGTIQEVVAASALLAWRAG